MKVSRKCLRVFGWGSEKKIGYSTPTCTLYQLTYSQWNKFLYKWLLLLWFLSFLLVLITFLLVLIRWQRINVKNLIKQLSPGGYSGFQVTGMIEGFFWVWNFRFRDFFGFENLASIFLGSLIWVGIFWGY